MINIFPRNEDIVMIMGKEGWIRYRSFLMRNPGLYKSRVRGFACTEAGLIQSYLQSL